MFRKLTFVVATAAALGAVALSPTSASAWGKGGWGGHHGFGWGRVGVGAGVGLLAGAAIADSCLRQRVFDTPYGPVVRTVNVCY
jgi:hypothetical protein